MKYNWQEMLGIEEEELRDILIALAVIALFGWLVYYMGWLKGDEDTVLPTAAAPAIVSQNIVDKDSDGILDSKDNCPLTHGVAANAGCPADADKDGVYDAKDLCPNIAGTALNNGCAVAVADKLVSAPKPDTDNDGYYDSSDNCPLIAGTDRGCPPDADEDGVIDSADRCPELAGVQENAGCPADTDQDGVYNTDDACIALAGVKENKGCPADSDADGVYDAQDKCPTVKGVELNNGCPADADRDGIPDTEDQCPTVAGTKANNGCSNDSDNDGIENSLDKCPNKAGIAENNGCPEVKITEQERKAISDAVKNVQFFTSSARPTEPSKLLLAKVADILKANPDYKLKIEGHTDSSGNPESNLALSKKRAFACFSYLVNQGIASKRLAHSGVGDAKPVADNATRAGRKQNRRVEFELHY